MSRRCYQIKLEKKHISLNEMLTIERPEGGGELVAARRQTVVTTEFIKFRYKISCMETRGRRNVYGITKITGGTEGHGLPVTRQEASPDEIQIHFADTRLPRRLGDDEVTRGCAFEVITVA